MMCCFRWICTVVLLLGCCAGYAQPDRYNVVWHSPSLNSAGSMPCGGGGTGLNVWVENGDVLVYLSRSGSFDENNTLLKLGRLRIHLDGNPFGGKDFRQELVLRKGCVQLSGGGAQMTIWADVFHPVVHVETSSRKPLAITAAYENWRIKDHRIQGKEYRQSSFKAPQPFPVITYKDSIDFIGDTVLFLHRNRAGVENVFDYTVRMEKLDAVKAQLYNPVINRTSGGYLYGDGMRPAGTIEGIYAGTPFRAWLLKSRKPRRLQHLQVSLEVSQPASVPEWQDRLRQTVRATAGQPDHKPTLNWWAAFWNRSFIHAGNGDTLLQPVARNYQLFRYQLGCNMNGEFPTKFNGGLFTFDPVFVDTSYPYTPDFRLWGGGIFTAQNQRLVYHPLIKSGDFDLLKPQFDFYLNNLKNAELRSQVYWQHGGASFTEQIENFGLPNIVEYNPLKRPQGYDAGMEYNAWLEYDWETVFEFCLMMLETERYEGRDIRAYLPFINSCLAFYDEHYTYLARQRGSKAFTQEGHYVLYPGSALETYKMAYNSVTTIASLQVILQRLLELPDRFTDTASQNKWRTMLQRLPPLSFSQWQGHTTIAPARAWERIQNTEAPQLYPVYPWGLFGIGRSGLDTAINTYLYDTQVVRYRSHIGWRQHNIFAARLGLTAEALELNRRKLQDAGHRFPTFWGPGFDWTPDHNWGGSGMIGLQEMLMQADCKKIWLLPAWPRDHDVHFKLHAPYQTTVECRYERGRITSLVVIPESRRADVEILLNDSTFKK